MYEIFEHTADLGIRACAEDLDHLFADAARGLSSVMVVNLDAVRTTEAVKFQLRGDDLEELLHDWLTEVLLAFHVRRLVLADFEVKVEAEPVISGLSATARGEAIDPRRHEIDMEVKAVTWHALKVEPHAGGWLAEVVVDV